MMRGRANGTTEVVDDAAGPCLHHADAAGEIGGFLEIMRHKQNRGALVDPQLLHDFPQFLAGELVERAEGFVEQQQRRIVDQGPAERSALLHAAGQLPGKLVAEAGEAYPCQRLLDAVAIFGALFAGKILLERRHDLERHHHVVADVQPRQQRRVLERHADPRALGAHLAPRHEHVAFGGVKRAGDEFENGRLAAAGRSDQGYEFAMADAQGGFRQRRDLVLGAAERHPDFFEINDISHRQRERIGHRASLFCRR